MSKIILLMILFIGLIGFSIYVGSWGCALGFCIPISIPLLIIVSILVALISIALLPKKSKTNKLKLSFLLVPTYIIISLVTGYSSLNYFHYKNLSEYLTKESNTQKQQRFDKVNPENIKKDASNLVYTCKECGYKITFPGDWGFQDVFYGSQPNGWQEFILVTPNFSENSPYQGQKFRVRSLLLNLPNTEFEAYQKSYKNSTLSEITVNGVKGEILKVHTRAVPSNEVLVRFSSKSHKFEVIAGYENEAELDKNLKIILDHFEFID